jgi:transcriptional regulator with XRE-family HTH domain
VALGRAFLTSKVCWRAVRPKPNLYKILGENIRFQRKKANLTQEELAEKAGVARNYIGNIERAEHKATFDTVARIAGALNMTVHELTRGI